MDPVRNPYAPGAGAPPPELAGRDALREAARVALERIRIRRSSKSLMLVGLRGVGKTVLLNRIRQDAEARGVHTLQIEASEHRSLPGVLAPQLRVALLKLSRREAARQLAQRAMRGLAGFVSALRVTYQDIEVGLDLSPEQGLADSGDFETDLPELFDVIGAAAQADSTCVALFIDEIQYIKEPELAVLITALHRISQQQLPVIMLGAGLPQLRSNLARARTYSERLFDFPQVGPLLGDDAKQAITKPAASEDVAIDNDVLNAVIERTRGYPYFLQEWGKHLWEVAESSPIQMDSLEPASQQAIAALDAGFFLVRFDRLTPAEKRYARAMAELGPGPHRSGDIAAQLNRTVQSLAPTRNQLISKGAVWSPSHGDTDFTVPMFDGFMKRIMPGNDWLVNRPPSGDQIPLPGLGHVEF